MPLHPVQRGELTDRLRRFFGLTGSYRADLEAIVNPVAVVQDISQVPYRFQSVQGWQSYDALGAVAAVSGFAQWRNPAGSGAVMIVDRLSARTLAAVATAEFFVRIGNGATVGAPLLSQANSADGLMDAGGVGFPKPLAITVGLYTDGTAPVGRSVDNAPAASTTAWQLIECPPWVIPPGFAISLLCSPVNTAFYVRARGRFVHDPALARQILGS